MKLNKHNGRFFAFFGILLVFISILSLSFAKTSSATSCTPVDKYITKSSDSTFEEVNFDFQDNDKVVVISADSGYTITEVWLDINGDGISGFVQHGTTGGTYNPSGNDTITEAKVRVIRVCSTPTATATATPTPTSVTICHQAGNSGNYTKNIVSVHSVGDANGLSGHGGHSGDVWAPFSYNSISYPGQGNYSAFNFSNCTLLATSTPVPTPTATPTGTSQPTYSPTATPTSTATSTPTATTTSTPEATATPNGDICANLDGIQLTMPDEYHHDNAGVNCLKFELGGPQTPSDPGTSQQVLGTSTSRVLGASTMAGTGAVEDALFNSIFTLGSLLTSFGIMKNGKKKA